MTDPDTTSGIIAEEISMSIQLNVGKYLDKGVPMTVIQAAVRQAADLLPGLEADAAECS